MWTNKRPTRGRRSTSSRRKDNGSMKHTLYLGAAMLGASLVTLAVVARGDNVPPPPPGPPVPVKPAVARHVCAEDGAKNHFISVVLDNDEFHVEGVKTTKSQQASFEAVIDQALALSKPGTWLLVWQASDRLGEAAVPIGQPVCDPGQHVNVLFESEKRAKAHRKAQFIDKVHAAFEEGLTQVERKISPHAEAVATVAASVKLLDPAGTATHDVFIVSDMIPFVAGCNGFSGAVNTPGCRKYLERTPADLSRTNIHVFRIHRPKEAAKVPSAADLEAFWREHFEAHGAHVDQFKTVR